MSWKPKTRDYGLEREQFMTPLEQVKDHPLLKDRESKAKGKSLVKTKAAAKKAPAEDHFDPLRMMMSAADSDPLSSMSEEKSSYTTTPVVSADTKQPELVKKQDDFETWQDKQPRILSIYSTSSRVAVTANFLEEKEEGKGVRAVDQTSSRLEELETSAGEDEQAKSYLSQKEYIAHMEEQHSRLKRAWEMGERVVSLKIAIQCAKLLGDTSVPQFYPSMYVLLGNILDTFGDLVYARIKALAEEPPQGSVNPIKLPFHFTSEHICADAKITCKNWFYKTACIRELMPRLYIDLALIKSYRFITDTGFGPILTRLSRSIRGIGDPLVAMYARCYLANKARQLNSFLSESVIERPLRADYQKPLLEAYDDFMFTMKSLKSSKFETVAHVAQKRTTLDEYLFLFSPALEWLCQNIGFGASDELFFALLDQYKAYFPNSVVLVQLLGNFGSQYISANALSLVSLIKDCDSNSKIASSKLYLALGKALMKSSPPEKQKLPILNEVWKVVTKIQNPLDYLEIADVFVQFLIKNFSDREVNIFLKDVIKHVKKATQDEIQSETFQKYLSSIVEKQIEYTKDLLRTLAMDNFLSMMDLLERPSKVPVAKLILTQFGQSNLTSNDPVIIHTLLDVAKSLHDSIDAQTFDDEKKQIAATIILMVRQIDFKRDLEQQLNFYVDCRAAFTRLDVVVEELVMRVLLLCSRALKMMKNKHTKKTSAFVKACLAYCHVSVPSLTATFVRLRLFLHCGEVSLQNGMIAQSEAFLKSAIGLIKDVPATVEEHHVVRSTEAELESYLHSFVSLLLVQPGHPKQGPFYLVQGLINAVSKYPVWSTPGKLHPAKTRVLIGVVGLLCAYYQRNFLYSAVRVDSNDALYGGDRKTYLQPLVELLDFVITTVLEQITAAPGDDLMGRKAQGMLALQMVNTLVSFLEMNKQTATVIVKLVGLAKKGGAVDPKFLRNTISHISNTRGTWYEDVTREIKKL